MSGDDPDTPLWKELSGLWAVERQLGTDTTEESCMTVELLVDLAHADRPDAERTDTLVALAEGGVLAAMVNVTNHNSSWKEVHIGEVTPQGVELRHSYVPLSRRCPDLQTGYTPLAITKKARMIGRAVRLAARVLPSIDTGEKDAVSARRELVRRYIEDFKNGQKFQVFPRMYASDFRHHFDFPGQSSTAASFVNVGVNLLDGFPDVHVTIRDLLVDGDLVLEHNSVVATHTGRWAGIAPTGRAVEWAEVHVYRVQNGRIVENWPWVDFEDLYRQVSTSDRART